MGYNTYSNFQPTSVNQPSYNFTKVITTAVDVDETWPPISTIAAQLNLYEDQSQDTLIRQYANAARLVIESYLDKNIGGGVNTCDVYYSANVFNQVFSEPVAYLDLPTEAANNIVITSVSYYTSDKPPVKTTIPSTDYFLDDTGESTRVIITNVPINASTIIAAPVIVGVSYRQSSILASDPRVILAALLLITHYYNNREAYTEMNLKAIPVGVSTLLSAYKDVIL